MGNALNTENGNILITEEVLATIAGSAAVECYGLVGMASRKLIDGVSELLGQEAYGKGVEVNFDDGQVHINLYIIVNYGVKISEVARNVMDRVKFSVESLTGLRVAEVNVFIQGVRVNSAK